MDTTIKKPDKKSLCYLAIVLSVALLVFAGLWYYLSFLSKPGPVIDEETLEALKRERIIKQQLEELEQLRGEVKPLTEKEIQQQLEELNKLR